MAEDMNKFLSYMNNDSTEVHKDFKIFETKVDRVMKILQDMNSSDVDVQTDGLKNAESILTKENELEDDESFIVNVKQDRTIINKASAASEPPADGPVQMDKFSFMQQVEQDANKRSEMRREDEKIAQNFRKVGNDAFRKCEYEKAVNMYNKAIDHVKDSPILYNNRALCYLKLKLYRRAIIDCDFVINKLDEKNLRGYLYRAAAYFKLNDDEGFDSSVKFAKKHNSKDIEYIDNYVDKIRTQEI